MTLSIKVLLRFALIASGAAIACDRSGANKLDERAVPSDKVDQAAIVQEPAPAPVPWYQGKWSARLDSGMLSAAVSEQGLVQGQWQSGGETTELRGVMDVAEETLRVRLVGPKLFGSLVAFRTGEELVGVLRASRSDLIDLAQDPPRLGQSWDIRLKRDP